MKTSIRSGAPFAALLAAFPLIFSPDEARAQQTGFCTPTQTVSATADPDGVYTTTLVCVDTDAAEGEADYRQVHYNHADPWVEWGQTNPADLTPAGTLPNNNGANHLVLTIGSGVVFTADNYIDQRSVPTDGAIVLWGGGGDKTVTVQDGAVINLERTPTYWHPSTDADMRVVRTGEGGDVEYDFNWYPTWQDALDGLTAIAVHSTTSESDSDVTVRLDGVINVDIEIGGTYGRTYAASAGRAIDVQIKDTGGSSEARADVDARVELGSTGVIRQVEGSHGLGGIYVENRSEDGDITVDLAEGSLIDVSAGGGYGVLAIGWRDTTNNNGAKTSQMTINAAGTIRTALSRGRVSSNNFGHGIFASQGADGASRLHVTSSGTIETVQASAIDARAYRSGNTVSDDPTTPEIEGHLVDVTAGTIETRGNTAIYTSTGSVDADMTVRVAEGATVRAQALTDEDYANGAATQEDLGETGNRRLQLPQYRFYGWRQVNVERPADGGGTETVVRSEPIITAIAMRDYTSAAPASGVRDQLLVYGTVEAIGGKADVDPAIWMERGGRIVVGATGRVSADSGLAILAGCVSEYRSGFTTAPADATTDCSVGQKNSRDLAVTVAGTVEGDIRLQGTGTLTLSVPVGGVVTGTVHDPVGPLTVAGSIGRLLYTNGATVTVAGTGALTGVEVDGRTEALGSEAGALSLTVNDKGMVTGDVQARGDDGRLTLDVKEGGTVTGTVHDPVGPLTVAGSIGRLLYTSGATVTVAGTGKLTGVEVDGRTEALGSEAGALSLTVNDKGMVTGDVRARGGGDLAATISGMVDGDLLTRGGGDLTLNLKEGGTVTGTVHDPAGPLTVAGSIGRLLYTTGAAVTVAAAGKLTGVEADGRTEALRSQTGDLDLTVAGRVTGDVLGLGAGDHTVTVAQGGAVTGTIRLAASTVQVDGAVGCVRLDRGGTVTVGTTGRIDCADGVSVRSETGDLTATVAGRVAGDVLALGRGEQAVTVVSGGTVTGTVRVATASTVTVAGTAGRVQLDRGGTVTVGSAGRVTGVEGVAVRSETGELAVVIQQAAGETVADAVGRTGGRIVEKGGRPQVLFQRAGEAEAKPLGGAPGTGSSVPSGAFDVGVVADGGGVKLVTGYAPRSRLYEALPSVVLGLNRLPEFRDRMAAPRTASGVGWARVETFRDKWKADESTTTPGLEYHHRRHGLKAGVDAMVGGHGLFGASFHHRRGKAEVSGGGDVELSGYGVGMSGVWLGDAGYVDVQAEATWYEVDFSATGRGVLMTDAPGRGHALGVEVGRRIALEAGMVLTPRAGLVHSKVSVGDFTDAVDTHVSLEDGRSLKGRAGLAVEMKPGGAAGSRVYGTVDVEREFSRDRKVVVSGRELMSEAEATWLRLGVNGVHVWDAGRYTVQGGVSYATNGGGREFGGGVSLSLRF